jgi:DNA sulfur modification protein DndC
MKYTQGNLFTTRRNQMTDSIQLTIDSLMAYCPKYKHWGLAWSGGKDSTTLVTLIVWLLRSGRIPKPESITIMYADTRMELPPLWEAAQEIISELREYGFEVRVVVAPIEKRFFCYMLGRGVPPPTNKFRWCTGKMKIEPMETELEVLFSEKGEKILMLTGIRIGESAVRDARIVMSCSKDGGECGQGWYQETLPDVMCDKLAPLLHWRLCHVWEWLKHWAPLPEYGDWSTAILAIIYGEDDVRTGCIGCNLVEEDIALANILKIAKYYYYKPLLRLKPLYTTLRGHENRLRKSGLEPGDNFRQRVGPLTMPARKKAFAEVMSIQDEINAEAVKIGMPTISLINAEEEAYIRKSWEENLWPQKWDGTEATGDTPMATVYKDGSRQPLIEFGN